MTDSHDTVTLDIPTPAAGPAMRMLEVASIEASLTNPRKTFDQVKLKELSESIKASGVHQPILVRPLPGSRVPETFTTFRRKGEPLPAYELVAGERRFRACRMANVLEIPAMIRELTDSQVLEIQIVENLQRDDLTELEEAEGYEYLMKQNGMNAEQVGAKIGKSRSYVYARLKLVDCCTETRTALREGKIDASKALLLARIPDHALQVKALKDVAEVDWQGETMSYRAAADYIQRHYMLRLDTARFKITDVTLVEKAGSCKECPKRTGHEPDLFADVKSADVCTDPKCFHAKEDAHAAIQVAKAKSKGQNVITGKEAAELMSDGYNLKFKGYRRLDVVEDSPTDQPLRKIIGAQMKADGIEPTMIDNPRKKGDLVAALPNDIVLRLLKLVEGQAQATKEVAKEVRQFADDKKAKADAKAKDQYEQDWRNQLIRRTWAELHTYTQPAFTIDVHRYLAVRAANSLSTDEAQAIAKMLDLGKVGAHSAIIELAKSTPDPDFLNMLFIMQRDSSAHDHSYNGRIANEGLLLVAGNVFQDVLPNTIEEIKAESHARFFPKTSKSTTARQLAAQPREGAGGEETADKAKGGDKKNTRPAAPKPVRKTTAAEAQQGIAAAMQSLGEEATPGAAVAAQGNEAPPVASAQVATATPDAAAADVSTAAPAKAVPASWCAGQIVRIKDGLKSAGGKSRKTCGRVCVVESKDGARIALRFGPRSHEIVIVDKGDIEPYLAAPVPGDKVRILQAGMTERRNAYRWRQGTVQSITSEGWSVMMPGKNGAVADFEVFDTTEMEVLE